MFQENEAITLLLGLTALVFIIVNHARLMRLPAAGLLLSAFLASLAGWTATVLEGFVWGDIFNMIEHAFYAAGSMLVAAWCWIVFRAKGELR